MIYIEIYNEMVQDLLNPGVRLQLRKDEKLGVTVVGVKVMTVESIEQLYKLLRKGNQNSMQHPTDADAVRVSKLSTIDLAGSERGSATWCAAAQFTEGTNVNKSLSAVSNCINSLADGQHYVPYRDSKLMRLLEDC